MGYLSDALCANIYKTRVSFLFDLYDDFVLFLPQFISCSVSQKTLGALWLRFTTLHYGSDFSYTEEYIFFVTSFTSLGGLSEQ